MPNSVFVNSRGSLWNRWDPHIHAPGTILGDQYGGSDPWEEFLTRVETSQPTIRALGVTDYYSIDLYQKVRERQAAGRLSDVALIFPNVEMRLGIGTAKGSAVNVHLLFSPEDPQHVELVNRFLSELHFNFQQESYRCERKDLIRLGKAYDKSIRDDHKALEVGSSQFKVNFDELRKAWKGSAWAQENALIAVAGGSTDGTSGINQDNSFTALRQEIEAFSHIIFSGQPQQREFWLGRGAVGPQELTIKWGGRKPCLHGSDAHRNAQVGSPDLDRFCWIKGNPTFEALRQACIEPEGRALVDREPPRGALPSQTISHVEVSKANWLATKLVHLNPGLIAIIGARGSGKTALADFIAAASHALSPHLNDASFVKRAEAYLANSTATVAWEAGDNTSIPLADVAETDAWESPRVQYLSQQFVEQLCSAEGLQDELLAEIERVIFQAHAIDDRMGASSFRELLDIRSARARNERARQELALAAASEMLTAERAKKASLSILTKQVEEKTKLIGKDKKERTALTSKGTKERAQRFEEISLALDATRGTLEVVKRRHRALLLLQDTVRSIRTNSAPAHLADLKLKYADASLTSEQWDYFRLTFAGDVDSILTAQIKAADSQIALITGPAKGEVEVDLKAPLPMTPLIAPNAKLADQTLTLLEKELNRLRSLIGVDAENAKKFKRLSEKIAKDQSLISRLEKEIELARLADGRIKELVEDRKSAYAGIFNALVEEGRELTDLYAPLKTNLLSQGGELGKLSFSIRRSVDVDSWRPLARIS